MFKNPTFLLYILSKKANFNIKLSINKELLQQQNYTKYLGVIIDSHLPWKEQINQIPYAN